MTVENSKTRTVTEASGTPHESNTVAVIGLILTGVAAAMCALMFAIADQLPDNAADFRELQDLSTTRLRLLILGCSTAVLVVVAFVLCAVGLFLPNRPRLAAIVGTIFSLLLMFGVFGVLLVGVAMNPPVEPASSTVTAEPSDAPPNVPPALK